MLDADYPHQNLRRDGPLSGLDLYEHEVDVLRSLVGVHLDYLRTAPDEEALGTSVDFFVVLYDRLDRLSERLDVDHMDLRRKRRGLPSRP